MRRHQELLPGTLNYSNWHYGLGPGYSSTNIDYVEFRNGKPVAVIEEKDIRGVLPDWQRDYIQQVADALNVPFYYVRHNCRDNQDEWLFSVIDVKSATKTNMTEPEYAEFIRSL